MPRLLATRRPGPAEQLKWEVLGSTEGAGGGMKATGGHRISGKVAKALSTETAG